MMTVARKRSGNSSFSFSGIILLIDLFLYYNNMPDISDTLEKNSNSILCYSRAMRREESINQQKSFEMHSSLMNQLYTQIWIIVKILMI